MALAAAELGRAAAPASAWPGSVLAVPGLVEAPMPPKDLLVDGVVTVLAVAPGSVPGAATALFGDASGMTGSVRSVLGADRARRLLVPVGDALVLVDVDTPGVEIRPGR